MISDDRTCQLILGYLRENPHAGDTLAGIVEWWIFRQQLNTSGKAVQRVLEELKRTGAVYERKTAGGRSLYFASRPGQSSSEEGLPPDEEGAKPVK